MTKCVACEYNASSWTVYQYDRDILNSSSFPSTPTHTLWPMWFTIGYANINEDVTTMYAVRENGYIYQYALSQSDFLNSFSKANANNTDDYI